MKLKERLFSESAIRTLVREALDGTYLTQPSDVDDPIEPNDVVDPSRSSTDISDKNYDSQSLPVESEKESQDDNNMKKTQPTHSTSSTTSASKKKVEEAIRKQVRKVLAEISPKFDTSYSGTDFGYEEDDDKPKDDKPKRAYKATAIGNMADVEGGSFNEIAQELGFSVAGAKQAVDKALEKARFMAQMDIDERELMVLHAMSDYIEELASTGELSPADVSLMKDHPDIVRELDGFREHLHSYVRRARKASGMQETLEHKEPLQMNWERLPNEGGECPECGSDNTEVQHMPSMAGYGVDESLKCYNCGKTFTSHPDVT